MNWKELLSSKRFVAVVVGVVMVIATKALGEGVVDPETVTMIVTLIASWVVGDSLRGLPSREDNGRISGSSE